jgi:hypothetical protein
MKMGTLAAIVGLKAVLLYLKQSPLPSTGGAADWSKVSGAVAFAALLPAGLMVSGCVSSWEQNTYATLATGKALIDCAVAGYNHYDADIRHACAADPADPTFEASRFYIVQTRDAQQAIEKARQAQIAAVEAFEAYAVAKVAHDKAVSLPEKEAAVVAYLAQLPQLLDAIRTLIGKASAPTAQLPNSPHGPGAALRLEDVQVVVASLKAATPALRSPDHQITRSPRVPSAPGFGELGWSSDFFMEAPNGQ